MGLIRRSKRRWFVVFRI